MKGIEEANSKALFGDDKVAGTPAEDEVLSQAAEADQAIVVLSRSFLAKKRPMEELNIFLTNNVKIYPLYYKVSPDELGDIVNTYERQGL